MQHIKELDSLRTIAVFFVIVSHWLPHEHLLNTIQTGEIGVDIFFVLSGYLISGILIRQKMVMTNENVSLGSVLKKFYIRRSLRIFPIYYLVAIGLIIADYFFVPYPGMLGAKDHEWAYALQLTNVAMWIAQQWFVFAAHLWSLAVEEQFYLIWPLLVLLWPWRAMPYLFPAIAALGIASNYIIGPLTGHPLLVNLLTPTCFDAFALGGWLAYIQICKPEQLPAFKKLALVAFLIVTPYWAVLNAQKVETILPLRTLVSISSLYLIVLLALPTEGPKRNLLQRALNQPSLVFLGTISYGMYLYHFAMPLIFQAAVNRFGYATSTLGPFVYVQFVASYSLLVLVAWLSFRFIERPINSLKNRFAY